MLKISNLKLPIKYTKSQLLAAISKKLIIPTAKILDFKILKQSIDARDKGDVSRILTVAVELTGGDDNILRVNNSNEISKYEHSEYKFMSAKSSVRPIIVGFGPAGMFSAYILAKAGLRPIVLERGEQVEQRRKSVQQFFDGGKLNTQSNIQFGEGGAGTFSDGKLNTGISDVRKDFILELMVKLGCPDSILTDSKPHVGTDYLEVFVRNIRNEIIAMGGEIRFNTQVTDFILKNGNVVGVKCGEEELLSSKVILAIGHSSRDTFYLLEKKAIAMQPKDFAVGVRIEHLQQKFDLSQYGVKAIGEGLKGSDYKVWSHLSGGRSVYSFCCCVGGEVVAGSSEEGMICTNGMSYYNRSGKNINSALLVNITAADFGGTGTLAGIEFQRKWERAAYNESGSYCAPASRVGDFLKGRKSTAFGEVKPTYPLGSAFSDFKNVLPSFVTKSIREAIPIFDRKIRGFAHPDAVISGVEMRSSSPVRITRDESFCSVSVKGLYPCGEGAGYAGGIMSAAIDGMKVAEAVIGELKSK